MQVLENGIKILLYLTLLLLDLTKRLAHSDHLTGFDHKLEVLRGLKDQHHGRAKLESAHLLTNVQGLTVQQTADTTVHDLTMSTLVAVLAAVSVELL